MVLFIFNPDTDLALANGKGNYTPTEGVRQMIDDLALLPIWYAEPNSYVLAEGEHNQAFLEQMRELLHIDVQLISLSELKTATRPTSETATGSLTEMSAESIEVCPWGWNRSFRNRLVRAGIDSRFLPSDNVLEKRRQLSQRNVVEQVLALFDNEPGFCGVSRSMTNTQDCEQYFNSMNETGGVVFKEPWSSSGKGLRWCREAFNERDKNWCQRVIDNQGYVAVSPIYNKVQDFAMEFNVGDEADVKFVGYSLFHTDKGFYKGNALLSNDEIVETLARYVSPSSLDIVKDRVGLYLAQAGYNGCVGVDMMVCQSSDGGYCIHPCVEVNYRATMGYLARLLKDNFLDPNANGRFMIQHFRSPSELQAFVNDNRSKAPLVIQNARVVSGFLPLVPVTPTSQNLAYIEVCFRCQNGLWQ